MTSSYEPTTKENQMKPVKRIMESLTKAALITGMAISFNACSEQSPMSSQTNVDNANSIKPLKFNSTNSLEKPVAVSQLVTPQSGGTLLLEHGTPNTTAIYANSDDYPYNVYRIDPANPGNSVVVGQLEFASGAIAMHPFDGLLYYVARYSVYGVYRVATWDPATNTNTLLPYGSTFKPAWKLAFGPDGTLYGLRDQNSYTDELYTIDTTTGSWSFVRDYYGYLDDDGDLGFSPDGVLYNLNEYGQKLQRLSLNSTSVTTVDYLYLDNMSGMVFGHDGQMYVATDENHKLYSVDPSNGNTTYLGTTNLYEIDDMAPVVALTELSYASLSLQVPPGAINTPMRMSLSIETTELTGGVAMTFAPHGTVFNSAAILNLEAHGVDFSGVNPAAVDIYYDNQETGQWEPMERDDIIIDVNAGTIQVINARLPHFSRYAIGMD